MVSGRPEPDLVLVERVGRIATALPDAYEEEAWTGVRWRVRKHTFAHVLMLSPETTSTRSGHEHLPGLIFRSTGEELLALSHAGPPFFTLSWGDDVVALLLDDSTDWEEVAELVTESYRIRAPRMLVRRLDGSS
ncbi:MmcQ/YjbR family DNA-binding protein [Nocardioides sp. GXZ039]|uniref:MmcQ/YjbR family DNA-binding protein n=1 Tax=Nocardioides sp. GXZ039 TaxID=3136018 RepID=UPI0030F47CF8